MLMNLNKIILLQILIVFLILVNPALATGGKFLGRIFKKLGRDHHKDECGNSESQRKETNEKNHHGTESGNSESQQNETNVEKIERTLKELNLCQHSGFMIHSFKKIFADLDAHELDQIFGALKSENVDDDEFIFMVNLVEYAKSGMLNTILICLVANTKILKL